jgi:hypothetical protein
MATPHPVPSTVVGMVVDELVTTRAAVKPVDPAVTQVGFALAEVAVTASRRTVAAGSVAAAMTPVAKPRVTRILFTVDSPFVDDISVFVDDIPYGMTVAIFTRVFPVGRHV